MHQKEQIVKYDLHVDLHFTVARFVCMLGAKATKLDITVNIVTVALADKINKFV